MTIKRLLLMIVILFTLSASSNNALAVQPEGEPELRFIFVISQSGNMGGSNSGVDPANERLTAVQSIINYLVTFYNDFWRNIFSNGQMPNIYISAYYFADGATPIMFDTYCSSNKVPWIDLSCYQTHPGSLGSDLASWVAELDPSNCGRNYVCNNGRSDFVTTTKAIILNLQQSLPPNPARRIGVFYISDGIPCLPYFDTCQWNSQRGSEFNSVRSSHITRDFPNVAVSTGYSPQDYGQIHNFMLGMGHTYKEELGDDWGRVIPSQTYIDDLKTELYPSLIGAVSMFLRDNLPRNIGRFYYISNRGISTQRNEPISQYQASIWNRIYMANAFYYGPNAALQITTPNQHYNANNPTSELIRQKSSSNNVPLEIWHFHQCYNETWDVQSLIGTPSNNRFNNDGVFIAYIPVDPVSCILPVTQQYFLLIGCLISVVILGFADLKTVFSKNENIAKLTFLIVLVDSLLAKSIGSEMEKLSLQGFVPMMIIFGFIVWILLKYVEFKGSRRSMIISAAIFVAGLVIAFQLGLGT